MVNAFGLQLYSGYGMAGTLSVNVPSNTYRERTSEKWDLFPVKLGKSDSLEKV